MDKNLIVVDTPGKLLEIHSKPQYGSNYDEKYHFKKSDVRFKIEKILDVTEDYSLLRTTVSDEAVKEVQANLESLNIKRKCECNDRYWLNDGTDAHYRELKHLLSAGKTIYASWPLVRKIKIHDCDVNQDAAFWPRIFLIRHCDESKFRNSLSSLHSDDVWERIVKHEAPQNYTLPVLELWREKRVIPLSIDEKVVRMHGENLKNAIDFLVQFENEYENSGHVCYVD